MWDFLIGKDSKHFFQEKKILLKNKQKTKKQL